jgi:triosephosphate isomerase
MKLIVGNWKMYPQTLAETKRIIDGIKKSTKRRGQVKVVICPPALFVAPLLALVKKTEITIGAQNAFTADEGAYTGETSPVALKNIGAAYVILGHSERRALGETDALIAQKAVRAVRNKLRIILCVGEHVRDDTGAYFTEVAGELRASLESFPKSEVKYLVIAYEPIWAIGAKALHAAEPEDFREMGIFIRRTLVDRFGKTVGFSVPILYGGSVDEKNAERFLKEGGADGFLVGRASLDPKKFSAIIETARRVH